MYFSFEHISKFKFEDNKITSLTEFITPVIRKDGFNCPHCGAFAQQRWSSMWVKFGYKYDDLNYHVGICVRCNAITIWEKKIMIFPLTGNAPLPNSDMPEKIQEIYVEARNITQSSPRAACILLRLCVEEICDDVGAKGTDLNKKIGYLVSQGLHERIQKSLDTVRVIGGQAAHPLQLIINDNPEIAETLFKIVNAIASWTYTEKKELDLIDEMVSNSKKKAICKRDEK